MPASLGHPPCPSRPYCWLSEKLVLWSGLPRVVLQSLLPAFFLSASIECGGAGQREQRAWPGKQELTCLQRRCRGRDRGHSPGMGSSRRACLPEMHGWAGRCVVLPLGWNRRLQRISMGMQNERTLLTQGTGWVLTEAHAPPSPRGLS